ncbi:MAG: DUF1206 domain-containing protein [Tranquillimonas sp.]|jgi:hypothetical protein
MASSDFSWAIPVMRAGYSGRALVYLVVAGFSLYAIWRGGGAKDTSSALAQLEGTAGGNVVLFLIFLGMLAYAVWRLVDSIWDLECYGSDAKGWIARIGMIVTGLIHLGIGGLAFTLLFTGGGGQGSSIPRAVDAVMGWPAGRWIVAAAGLVTIGAGLFYIGKAWKEKYREHLRANHFTMNWNPALKAGLAAQGLIVALIGGFLTYAAFTADPGEAGGVGKAFSWLSGQPYGRALVAAVCVGLLGFALFCAVNAAYRVVPRARAEGIETLAQRMEAKARSAMS